MSQKFKREKSQLEPKKPTKSITNEKPNIKTVKTLNQIPCNPSHLHSTNNNSNFTSSNDHYQNTPDTINFNSYNTNQNYLNVKLNRIQSQYIRPVSSQLLSKTPKITKINIDSNKLKKQNQKKNQIPNENDYCISQSGQRTKKKTQIPHQNKQSSIKNTHKQSQIKKRQQFIKHQLKVSKTLGKSLTRERSSFDNQPIVHTNGKQKINWGKKQLHSHKSELKKKSSRCLDPIKLNDKMNTPNLKKTPSSCSVKRYYVLQKNKPDSKSDKKGVALTTTRGMSNPEDHFSVGYGKSSTNFLKIYNSSTDLNNTIKSSQKEKEILQRIQRTLEYYQINLDQQIEKRKTLEIQNSFLKEELIMAIRSGK